MPSPVMLVYYARDPDQYGAPEESAMIHRLIRRGLYVVNLDMQMAESLLNQYGGMWGSPDAALEGLVLGDVLDVDAVVFEAGAPSDRVATICAYATANGIPPVAIEDIFADEPVVRH